MRIVTLWSSGRTLASVARISSRSLELNVGELEQMEREQECIGVGEGGVIGHGAGAGDARTELAEIDLAAVVVGRPVELEIAS